LEYRIASLTDSGRIELTSNGSTVSVLTLPVTGSWDAWRSVSALVQLSKGPQVIRMAASQGGFRLNWIRLSSITGVKNADSWFVKEFRLSQNYPNPFNPSTTISFGLPSRSFVSLKVFDMIGREVAIIVSEELPSGNYSRQWNAAKMTSGIYFYRLQAGSYTETKKLILLR
jgi:hypothetical protein